MALIDRYLKKKDSKIELERSRPLLIDKYSPRKEVPFEIEPEKKPLFDRIKGVGVGAGKFVTRLGIETANLLTSTLDFTADFLAGQAEKQTRRPSFPVGPFAIPIGKETEARKKVADRWKNFYEQTGGEVTEKTKSFTEELREIDFIQPSEEWAKASTKEKFTKRLPETILNIGPGVVSSLALFAISPPLGFAASAGSVADEVKTIAIEEGVNKDRAELLGLGTGLLVGWLDKIVPDEVFSPAQKKAFVGGFAKRIVKTGLKETVTEIAQENIQLLAEATVREDITKDEVVFRNLMSGLGGLLGGVGAQTTVSFVNGVRSGDIAGLEEDFVEPVIKLEEEVEKPKQPEVKKPIREPVEPLVEKPKVQVIPKELVPLAEEARKYKSAEEFVKKLESVRNFGTSTVRRNKVVNALDSSPYTFDKLTGKIKSDVLRNNPQLKNANITVYRVTIGDSIEAGDYVFTSPEIAKSYIKTQGEITKGKIAKRVIKSFEYAPAFDTSTQINNSKRGTYLYKDIKPTFSLIEGIYVPKWSESLDLTDFYTQATKRVEPVKPAKITPKKPSKPIVSRQPAIKVVTEKQIKTTKDIKSVKSTLKNIRVELSNAVIEAEGLATVAQEKRAGVNVEDINKLKRIYALNKKFQEGDIETIRASRTGGLLNRVVENVQEIYPHLSEQEAFEFALGLPTKAQESARTPAIRELEKKEKKLGKFLDLLKSRQKELKIQEDNELSKEWTRALAVQEKLISIVRIPKKQLPVGEGKVRASRLQARLKGVLGEATPEQIEELGLSTYRQSIQDKQIADSIEYVQNNTEDAVKVVFGEIDPPEGMLQNSVYIALTELGRIDTDVATKVATLGATRFGQEINILKKILADNPVVMMQDIVDVRIEAYEKRTGRTAKQRIKTEVEKIGRETKAPDIKSWNSFLDSIKC